VARGINQLTSGAFPGVLMRRWSCVSVRGLLYDMSEVLVGLSFTEGAGGSRCSMSFGGSESLSEQMVQVSIYSKIEGNSKQKLTIGTWLKIGSCFISKI